MNLLDDEPQRFGERLGATLWGGTLYELAPWEIVWFRRGEAGAHQLRNDGDEPVRFVMLSTVSDPEVVVYPDSDKVGAAGSYYRRSDAGDYWEGEA